MNRCVQRPLRRRLRPTRNTLTSSVASPLNELTAGPPGASEAMVQPLSALAGGTGAALPAVAEFDVGVDTPDVTDEVVPLAPDAGAPPWAAV